MLAGESQTSLCSLNTQRLWTADTAIAGGRACPNEGHITRAASAQSARAFPPQCENRDAQRAFVCCGDRGLPETWQSELACRELGWPIDNPNSNNAIEARGICAASRINVSGTFSYATTSRCVEGSWYNAEAACATQGARLCDAWELARNEAASPDCGFGK